LPINNKNFNNAEQIRFDPRLVENMMSMIKLRPKLMIKLRPKLNEKQLVCTVHFTAVTTPNRQMAKHIHKLNPKYIDIPR
jgi:hypothetical protein